MLTKKKFFEVVLQKISFSYPFCDFQNLWINMRIVFQCLLECVFNETQIIQNGQVNTANLKARFDVELQPDPEYIPIAMNAVQTCYTFGKNNLTFP